MNDIDFTHEYMKSQCTNVLCRNIDMMRSQLQDLCCSFDWSRVSVKTNLSPTVSLLTISILVYRSS